MDLDLKDNYQNRKDGVSDCDEIMTVLYDDDDNCHLNFSFSLFLKGDQTHLMGAGANPIYDPTHKNHLSVKSEIETTDF